MHQQTDRKRQEQGRNKGYRGPIEGKIENWSTGLKIGANGAGPRSGPFPGPPGAGLGREAAQNRRFPVLPPPTKT